LEIVNISAICLLTLEHPFQWMQNFLLFCTKKNLLFQFYILIFTKHLYLFYPFFYLNNICLLFFYYFTWPLSTLTYTPAITDLTFTDANVLICSIAIIHSSRDSKSTQLYLISHLLMLMSQHCHYSF